jgi:peptidyl-prolyl cis-trans isomerase SurA
MKKSIFVSFLFASSILIAQQVDKKATIFTIAGQPVTVGEFEYVYTKNNLNNQADYSEKSLTEYLKLYENFRLKVKEAEALKLDTIPSLINELNGYRKQLAKNYLTDREISEALVKEAYERSLKEVNAAHILVKCDENANPADTLAAYKKALDIRKKLLKGEDFGKLAIEYSDDPSAQQNRGDIGYFTVFQTVYPFESAAYNTKVGEISMPVRTNFGYHLVKGLAERSAQGEILVAHVLRKFPENATPEQKNAVAKFVDSIYNQLVSGKSSFTEAVSLYTEDKTTKGKNGELPWFSTGRMVPEFEKAAFSLKVNGDLSKPVQTAYGWHIIKRLDRKTALTFDEAKSEIKRKVERDSRSQVAKSILLNRIKMENKFTENVANKTQLFKAVDSTLINGRFFGDSLKLDLKKPLFTFAGNTYSLKDFTNFVERSIRKRTDKNKDQLLAEYYDNFVSQTCLDYEESQLEIKKPEFASLMREYRDGILLFELTDRKVWSYALKDSAGLNKFYEGNKNKYMWNERVDAEVFNCSDKKIGQEAYKIALKNKSAGDIQLKLNKENAQSKVSVISGKYEKGQYDAVDQTNWMAGTSALKMLPDSSYQFVRINKVIVPEPKSLKEAKGFIISDYQEFLEKNWMQELRSKYAIVVNNEVFRALIKK